MRNRMKRARHTHLNRAAARDSAHSADRLTNSTPTRLALDR